MPFCLLPFLQDYDTTAILLHPFCVSVFVLLSSDYPKNSAVIIPKTASDSNSMNGELIQPKYHVPPCWPWPFE